MHIERVVIKHYRCLADVEVPFQAGLNLIVGNNECGKSTLLEAINLALTGQLNGRPAQGELHPYLFHADTVAKYIAALKGPARQPPPAITIELYFGDHAALAKLRGTNNSRSEDKAGVKLTIEFDATHQKEYDAYIADAKAVTSVPIEYYRVRWRGFDGNDITVRSIPLDASFIDASAVRNTNAASRYVLDAVKSTLSTKQRADLALAYRGMRESFLAEPNVKTINDGLAAKKGAISDKTLSLALDASSRASWEAGVVPQLDDIPMTLVGKGEQHSVKIKLAMDTAEESHVVLVEEPENHLSFASLNALVKHIDENRGGRQVIITTHSSFVLNKLGLDSVILFSRTSCASLTSLDPETRDYFLKLPGHDTLRMILCRRAILVEGPSDELIVQKAYALQHMKLPLEAGVDVISVGSLAFKRFLDIALLLGCKVDVVTDNDGAVADVTAKYTGYIGKPNVAIRYDGDEQYPTLEPQLLKANDLATLNRILGKSYSSEAELLGYMKKRKTECALKFLETAEPWKAPEYIRLAIAE